MNMSQQWLALGTWISDKHNRCHQVKSHHTQKCLIILFLALTCKDIEFQTKIEEWPPFQKAQKAQSKNKSTAYELGPQLLFHRFGGLFSWFYFVWNLHCSSQNKKRFLYTFPLAANLALMNVFADLIRMIEKKSQVLTLFPHFKLLARMVAWPEAKWTAPFASSTATVAVICHIQIKCSIMTRPIETPFDNLYQRGLAAFMSNAKQSLNIKNSVTFYTSVPCNQ